MSKKDERIAALDSECNDLYLDIAVLNANACDLREKARGTYITLVAQDDKILGVAGKAAKDAQLVLLKDLFDDLAEV